MDLSIFRGKTVLVTGATGFKGSWLVLWLEALGANVVGFSLPALDEEAHYTVARLDQRIRHVGGDIRDFTSVCRILREAEPEFVFHLAAQALVRVSYDEPKVTFDTNVAGSVNILEAVRACDSVRALVFVTSDKCYRNREWVWGYRENDELGGDDPYSASKAAAELVFAAYCRSFFAERREFGAASVRAGNAIGGGDCGLGRLVPDCIRALRRNEPIRLRHPYARRPWQHVLEPLGGYLLLASALYKEPAKYSGAWNFGPEAASVVAVKELAENIVAAWGSGIIALESEEPNCHEAGILQLNCDKAHRHLGWRSQWNLNTSVQRTVEWYSLTRGGGQPYAVSRSQIEAYTAAESTAAAAGEQSDIPLRSPSAAIPTLADY